MKIKYYFTLLLTILFISLLTACGMRNTNNNESAGNNQSGAAANTTDTAEGVVESTTDITEGVVENTTNQASTNSGNVTDKISEEEAEKIALDHAGFTANVVTGLYTEYEIDDGVPEYEVQFYKDNREYDYTIHAETGAILSYDRDD